MEEKRPKKEGKKNMKKKKKKTRKTVQKKNRKSLIQHCERSELRLHFEWRKVD